MQSLPLTLSIKPKQDRAHHIIFAQQQYRKMKYEDRQITAGYLEASKPTATAVITILYDL